MSEEGGGDETEKEPVNGVEPNSVMHPTQNEARRIGIKKLTYVHIKISLKEQSYLKIRLNKKLNDMVFKIIV